MSLLILPVLSSAQVDLGVFYGNGDTLEVRLISNQDFDGVVSNVVFSLRWDNTSGATLGQIKQDFPQLVYCTMAKSGAETDSANLRYQIFGGLGFLSLNNLGTSWVAGQEVVLLKIPVTGPAGEFTLVNDSYVAVRNGSYFVSLDGRDRTGVFYAPIAGICEDLLTTYIATNPTCNGATLGSIDLSLGGGSAPFTYRWSNGETTQDLTNLQPGEYGLKVSDVNGCFEKIKIPLFSESDTIDPVIVCPADIQLQVSAGNCSAVLSFSVTASDNCSGESVTQTGGLASGSTFALGSTTNSFSATDRDGNLAVCSFDVTVIDTIAPILTCPGDTISCDSIVAFAISASDNCGGATVSQLAGLASGSSFLQGTTLQQFSATDASGNQTQCSFNITTLSGLSTLEPKLSAVDTALSGLIEKKDQFGRSVAFIGDVNGDGFEDMAVGSPRHSPFDNSGVKQKYSGAVYILMLNGAQEIISVQRISVSDGNLGSAISIKAFFGSAVCGIGDLNRDGVPDIAVGHPSYSPVVNSKPLKAAGAVEILFLNSDGTVKTRQRISRTEGGFFGTIGKKYQFGSGIANIGDMNADGIDDLAVGSPGDSNEDGAEKTKFGGAIWLLCMKTDGTVSRHHRINSDSGSFSADLGKKDKFGSSICSVGDIDADGIVDLAVGAPGNSEIVNGAKLKFSGAVYVLRIRSDGYVKAWSKVSAALSDFNYPLEKKDIFGWSVAGNTDIDGDGISELFVGASLDDDVEANSGAVYQIYLTSEGRVKVASKLSNAFGTTPGLLDKGDLFGSSLAVKESSCETIVVSGAELDDDGDRNSGAVWQFFAPSAFSDSLPPVPPLANKTIHEISESEVGEVINLSSSNSFAQISIYPNPAENLLFIERSDDLNSEVQVIIRNAMAQIVKKVKLNESITTINVERLNSGLYYVELINSENNFLISLIKR